MTLVHADSYAARPLKTWADTIIEELPDASSEAGAARIDRTIREHWRRRGYVPPSIRTERFHHGLNHTKVVCVRSNMINGFPVDGRRT